MIPIPSGVRVWIATGHTDMRRRMQGLALQVQESLKRDPHAGDLYIFRGRRGDLAKILWHDGIGLSLYAIPISSNAPFAHRRSLSHYLKSNEFSSVFSRPLPFGYGRRPIAL
jgi:transposase